MVALNKEKRITVVGMGQTGLSCARYLLSKKMPFRIIDSREKPLLLEKVMREFPLVEKYCGDLSTQNFDENDILIVSPGLSLQEPFVAKAIENGAEISSDIEIFLAEIDVPILAITGSNGKSTVTTLVGEILKQAGKKVGVSGNIGVPVLEQLLDGIKYEVFVLELSSFQLERITNFHAKVVTMLNVTEDHMDRYDSFNDYHLAKQRIYMGAENIVLNRNEELTRIGVPSNTHIISCGMSEPTLAEYGIKFLSGKEYIVYQEEIIIAVEEIKIKGRHNVSNVMAAIAMSRVLDIQWNDICIAIKAFKGLRHRCEWVDEINGVSFYNDSKATNVGAAIAAISGFPKGEGRLILLAGGLDKDSDFMPLGEIVRNRVSKVYLIGKDAPKLYQAFGAEMCFLAKDLTDAVKQAFHCARKGDVVLLAPACASFDMFTNYEHRGDVFTSIVKSLKVDLA